ncbi:MAG: glycosyltransferase family 2 protein [bacterium]
MQASRRELTVGVVLVNWNSGSLTLSCIRSLMDAERKPDRIIVFDNASTDGSPDEIIRIFPQVELVRHRDNLGFAAPCNAGARRFIQDGMDVIWLLNNDTVVGRHCLAALLEEFKEHPDVDVATGKILFSEPRDRIWYGGSRWYRCALEPRHTGLGETDTGQYDQAVDTRFISGCCMAVRSVALQNVGLFDERYFAYSEDAEWCLRAAAAGIRMRYQPRALLWHAVSASVSKNTMDTNSGTVSPLFIYLSVRNRIFLIRQHAKRPWQLVSAVFLLMCHTARIAIRVVLMGRWAKVRSLWQGVKDGFTMELAQTTDFVGIHRT